MRLQRWHSRALRSASLTLGPLTIAISQVPWIGDAPYGAVVWLGERKLFSRLLA